MTLEKRSPCKVNLLLNILGKRPDGFHELETIMQPVAVFDLLNFSHTDAGIQLTCSDPSLPTDNQNLVHRAAARFLAQARVQGGVRIHLEKNLPLAAGLGGGSGNAATTLLALNEMFEQPLSGNELNEIAASLGSDIPFFLQSHPAIAMGRGETVKSLDPFAALTGKAIILIHPGFGISTAWAYQTLAQFPEALNGRPGRAKELVELLQQPDFAPAAAELYNSLEAPALNKYPLLVLFQEFFRENGAAATLMSGSGSTTFAIASSQTAGEQLLERFKSRFGTSHWSAIVSL
jgi:4-diphosphocytidyl-2-C-methyl-D-erythritol kinase